MKKILFISNVIFLNFFCYYSQVFTNEFNNSGLPLGVTISEIQQIIDFNNDGFEDLIYAYDSSNVTHKKLYKNNGNGSFTNINSFNIGNQLEFYKVPNDGWMKIFDFNIDGYMDIVCQ
jgi:hypothetical protein